MEEFKGAKDIYQSTQVPKKLECVVNSAISKSYKRSRLSMGKKLIYTCASTAIVFVTALNISPVFAQNVLEIPIIGKVAEVLTFRQYEKESDSNLINVEIPAISNTGNEILEAKINSEIDLRVQEAITDAELRAEEYKEAFFATGGKEKDFNPIKIDVNYQVKSSTEKFVSFVITKTETLGNAYNEQIFYNIDIQTGKELTLQDMLGEDYKNIVDESVKRQMKERTEADSNTVYFDEFGAFEGIREDQKFYIKEDGTVVIVFEKYEIAPGSMGIQEFEIENKSK